MCRGKSLLSAYSARERGDGSKHAGGLPLMYVLRSASPCTLANEQARPRNNSIQSTANATTVQRGNRSDTACSVLFWAGHGVRERRTKRRQTRCFSRHRHEHDAPSDNAEAASKSAGPHSRSQRWRPIGASIIKRAEQRAVLVERERRLPLVDDRLREKLDNDQALPDLPPDRWEFMDLRQTPEPATASAPQKFIDKSGTG